MPGAYEGVPVVEDLIGKLALHATDDQRIDLGGDLRTPAHRTINCGNRFNDLNLLPSP
jgi:hypothetical protein